jgi:hypothetical protein
MAVAQELKRQRSAVPLQLALPLPELVRARTKERLAVGPRSAVVPLRCDAAALEADSLRVRF